MFYFLDVCGSEVVRVEYRGVWEVVDNNYHNWSVIVPPFKSSSYRNGICWSDWLELMRKEVEYTFGILKGRFRLLKTGVHLNLVELVNIVW